MEDLAICPYLPQLVSRVPTKYDINERSYEEVRQASNLLSKIINPVSYCWTNLKQQLTNYSTLRYDYIICTYMFVERSY